MKTTFKYLLVLVLAGFTFTGCATHQCCKMQSCKTGQWEYKTLRLVPGQGDCVAQLNQAGKEGWKLVTVVPIPNLGTSDYTFERPKH